MYCYGAVGQPPSPSYLACLAEAQIQMRRLSFPDKQLPELVFSHYTP